MSSITAKVGSYGTLKGFTNDEVAEFRGVPFASIPARWRRSVKLDKLPSSEFDATKYGPMATQRRIGETPEFNIFGPCYSAFQEEDKKRSMSELECLNLNIAVPKDAIGSHKKLPVMLWIHGTFIRFGSLIVGGGFEMGAGSEAMYKGANLVKESIKLGEPIIAVSVNYRLNLFGFIASKELEKDNATHGGGVGNYGTSLEVLLT
jgi:carboxylesterase type B